MTPERRAELKARHNRLKAAHAKRQIMNRVIQCAANAVFTTEAIDRRSALANVFIKR